MCCWRYIRQKYSVQHWTTGHMKIMLYQAGAAELRYCLELSSCIDIHVSSSFVFFCRFTAAIAIPISSSYSPPPSVFSSFFSTSSSLLFFFLLHFDEKTNCRDTIHRARKERKKERKNERMKERKKERKKEIWNKRRWRKQTFLLLLPPLVDPFDGLESSFFLRTR